jgi:hypothetical protein
MSDELNFQLILIALQPLKNVLLEAEAILISTYVSTNFEPKNIFAWRN